MPGLPGRARLVRASPAWAARRGGRVRADLCPQHRGAVVTVAAVEQEDAGSMDDVVAPSRELRQVLAELELLSHGTTQGWNKSGRSSERDTRPAGGDSCPPHESFRIDWECARS